LAPAEWPSLVTDTSPELWQIVLDVLVALGTVGAVVADTAVRSCRPQCRLRYHAVWQPGQVQTAAGGGAGRRSAKNAAAPINRGDEAHNSREEANFSGGSFDAFSANDDRPEVAGGVLR
jgi:hypothetical protein